MYPPAKLFRCRNPKINNRRWNMITHAHKYACLRAAHHTSSCRLSGGKAPIKLHVCKKKKFSFKTLHCNFVGLFNFFFFFPLPELIKTWANNFVPATNKAAETPWKFLKRTSLRLDTLRRRKPKQTNVCDFYYWVKIRLFVLTCLKLHRFEIWNLVCFIKVSRARNKLPKKNANKVRV